MHGQTPLLVVVSRGHKEAVETLLGAGARIDVYDNERKGALHLIVESEYFGTNIVKLLLVYGAPSELIDINNMILIHCAIPYNRGDIVDVLFKSGVVIDIGIRRLSWMRKFEDGADVYVSKHEDEDED